MSDFPENDTPHTPEVSTEAARQALDAMSEELLQKLNHMIEEQDARVQEFAVQNPSLSSLPVTPKPIELPTRALQESKPAPATVRVPQPRTAPQPKSQPQPRTAPLPPTFPPKDEPQADISPQEAVEEFERRWKQIQNERKQQHDRNQEEPPVPPARFPKPSLPVKTAKPKKESSIGTWVFFIVVLIILMRACSE